MGELQGIARFKFHPGKVEEFKRLSEQAMAIVREREPNTLQYEVFFNADESEAIVLERYTDSAALQEHLENMSEVMGPVVETGEVYGEILGELSPELQAAHDPDGPVQHFTNWISK